MGWSVVNQPDEAESHSIPIRLVFTNKPTRDDKLLLAFDALVMSKVLNREVALRRIVYGDDYVTLNVRRWL